MILCWCILIFVSSFCYCFCIILFSPSLWGTVRHSGGDHAFLSWCIATFSAGRACSSKLAGMWADKVGDVQPVVTSLILSVAGSIVFIIADHQRSLTLLITAESVYATDR